MGIFSYSDQALVFGSSTYELTRDIGWNVRCYLSPDFCTVTVTGRAEVSAPFPKLSCGKIRVLLKSGI